MSEVLPAAHEEPRIAPRAWPASGGLFVIGTDTGVGKTHVSCALLRGLAAHGQRAVGMKPIAAGAQQSAGAWHNDDVLALRAASNVRVPAALDNPLLLSEALSPHLAAARAGLRIDIASLVAAYRALAQLADVVVVEGAGGFLVPLHESTAGALLTGADLALALELPLLLVVGLRLGCLNHTLLTLEALRARRLTLAGWVANRIDPRMERADDNLRFLQRHIEAPLWADLPHGSSHALIEPR